jgi:hypothetical protein
LFVFSNKIFIISLCNIRINIRSYVWKKNSDGVQLSRLLTAIGAACIGFVCGYKVKTTDVDSYITQGDNEYFVREYKQKKIELSNRNIQKVNMGNDIRYTTTPIQLG